MYTDALNLTHCEHGCRREHFAFFFLHDWQLPLENLAEHSPYRFEALTLDLLHPRRPCLPFRCR